MRDFSPIYDLPNVPAVYAFYSGGRGPQQVTYVGTAGKLKPRIIQHLIRRDSSVTTGTSAASLNPDYVTNLSWWEHQDFEDTEKLKAAEMVAFDVLNPVLRSRGAANKSALQLISDKTFYEKMEVLFESSPTGNISFPSLSDTLKRINELENRIQILEASLEKLSK
jgi:hypothetical protein